MGVEGLAAVMIGATVAASPIPRAPGVLKERPLPPPPEPGFVTVRPQSAVVVPVSLITAVTDVGLLTVALVTETSGEVLQLAPPVNETVAPYSKPEPRIATVVLDVVAEAGTAEGLAFSTPLPTVKAAASVTDPPSVLVTVTA
jgi:hypothetical protein